MFCREEATMNGAPKRVLIIDDDALARALFRMLFEWEGYQCEEAENGAAGLKSLENCQADLVITDYQMPVLDGLEFLNRLAQSFNRNAPPVIVLTCNPTPVLKERAFQSGAYAVMGKPYNMEELRSTARSLLSTTQSASASPM
jgi:two-component system chemotaxis response regulator CheY